MSLATFQAKSQTAAFITLAALAALVSFGCPSATPVDETTAPAAAKPPPTLRLLVVDDSDLAVAIEREWRASGRGDIEISQASPKELAETKRLAADVVIYPAAMLGDFAERHLIVPLPTSVSDDDTFAGADILPLLKRRECTWGEKMYAVPFGSPQLMLLYRRDYLEKLKAAPPKTWAEYQELVARFRASPDGAWLQASVEPLADGWGAKFLLARAAAYARHPNQYSALFDYQTMEPLIATPPYVRALEELIAVEKASKKPQAFSPAECEQAMLDGRTLLALTWPTRVSKSSGGGVRIGCAELPGATEVYNFHAEKWSESSELSRVPLLGVSGRLGSITSSARHTRAAADALLWLAGKEKGPLIASQSSACTLARSSQVPQASRFVSDVYDSAFAGEYGEALETANERPLSMEMPRIPGHETYLAALDAAVLQAVAGEKTPANALAEAAAQWREITAKRGLDRQKAAYMRSLGLEP